MMQAQPTPPFRVIEAEFFRQLLVCLLADPRSLDRRGEGVQRRAHGMVRQVVLPVPVRAPFAQQPRERVRQVLALAGFRTIGDSDAHGRTFGVQGTARSRPSAHRDRVRFQAPAPA